MALLSTSGAAAAAAPPLVNLSLDRELLVRLLSDLFLKTGILVVLASRQASTRTRVYTYMYLLHCVAFSLGGRVVAVALVSAKRGALPNIPNTTKSATNIYELVTCGRVKNRGGSGSSVHAVPAIGAGLDA